MSQDENAVNDQVVAQEPTATESAAVETKAPEVADSFNEVWNDDAPASTTTPKSEPKAETEDKPSEEAPTEEQPSDAPVEETPADEQPRGKAEDRKQQLNSEIRDLVARRNAIKQEVEKYNAETYQAQSPEDLLGQVNPETGEYYNPLEAKVAAMEQSQALERYNTQVADSQLTLEHESSKVMQDFPIFNPDSPDYQAEIATNAAQLLQANLIFDQNSGQVIGSHVSPYQLYQTLATAAKSSAIEGQIAGQKATEKMLANADTTPGAAPPKAKADPILDIWKD